MVKLEVHPGGDKLPQVIETDESLQFNDYQRLCASIQDRCISVREVRSILAELETVREQTVPSEGPGPIDSEISAVTVVAQWAGVHERETTNIAVRPSRKLDLVLAAIEAIFPEAEVRVL